jgi:nitric oxide reductase subunit B
MGIHRALWQAGLANESFGKMSSSSGNWVLLFIIFGTLLFLSMGTFIVYLLIKSWKKNQINIPY